MSVPQPANGNRATAALQAHAEYRALGFEPIPIRIAAITDDRGDRKKRPVFPMLAHHDKPTWETAREIGRDPASLESQVERFPDVALVCAGLAAFDFDLRTNDGETPDAFKARVREAMDTYGLKAAVWERTGKGLHAIVQAPPEELDDQGEPIPWKKRAFKGDPLLDEIQVGAGALLFVAPSFHPVVGRHYERRSELRPVTDLPVCPVELLRIPEIERAPPPRPLAHLANEDRGSGKWDTLDVVGLFKEAGMYRKPLGGGKHGVVCPWTEEHSTGSDGTDTVVWEGANGNAPTFKCLHGHCADRWMRDVHAYFGADAVDRWCRERFEPQRRPNPPGRVVGEIIPPGGPQEPPGRGQGPMEEPPDLTEMGNSSRLVQLHGQRLHHVGLWGKWLVWDDDLGIWTLDHGDVRVRELAKDISRQLKREAGNEADGDRAKALFKWGISSQSASKITGSVNLARGIKGIPLDHEDLDATPHLLGVSNGVVDLVDGSHNPADPAHLMTLQCPVAWDPEATAPRWLQAMEEWFPEPELRDYVHRVAGAALMGAQAEHVFVIHYGGGRNGKGTFTRALQHVLGPYAGVIHLSLLVHTRKTEHDTVKADLFRTRLAVASETQKRVKLDEASVKNLTGGDRISARRMREDPWAFDPTHSLWLQTNHLPEIKGRDTGIWSRVKVVEWKSTFTGTAQDTNLDETLQAEAPGILRWLVDGCLAWQEKGLTEPEQVVRATLRYRQGEDTFGRFQKDMDLVFAAGLEIPGSDMQQLFADWAAEEGLDVSPKGLGDWLKEQGAKQGTERHDGKRRRVWRGVGVENDQNHETEQTHVL